MLRSKILIFKQITTHLPDGTHILQDVCLGAKILIFKQITTPKTICQMTDRMYA